MSDEDARIHLLDVGTGQFGDAVLYEWRGQTVLVDGAHRGDDEPRTDGDSLVEQLTELLGSGRPIPIDLLVVSHAHDDHIGCLPELVANNVIAPQWAYLPDPDLAWPSFAAVTSEVDVELQVALAGLREEDDFSGLTDDQLFEALTRAAEVKPRYEDMVLRLSASDSGCQVVFHGEELSDILAAFDEVGLGVIGPDRSHLEAARAAMDSAARANVESLSNEMALRVDSTPSRVDYYKAMEEPSFEAATVPSRVGAAVNAQSAVLLLGTPTAPVLLCGDMQFASPGISDLADGVRGLWEKVVAARPYSFVKLSHHGSPNSNPEGFPAALNCETFGVCTGSAGSNHPSASVLDDMAATGSRWVRTDTNGLSTAVVGLDEVTLNVTRGPMSDLTPS